MDRRCAKCGTTKPLEQFRKHRKCRDGRTYECKTCAAAAQRARRDAMDEAKKAQQRHKQREWMRADYQANPDKYRARSAENRASNPEKVRADQRSYYATNRDRWESYNREYRRQNPEKIAEWAARRRARQANGGTYAIRPSELARLYSSPCAGCGSRENMTVDHIVPLARGGRHSIGNLQPLCLSCNTSKRASLLVEWKYRRTG